MLIRLDGTVKFRGAQFVVVDVNGAGYKVFVSPDTLRKVPKLEENVVLWVHLRVKEDALDLYGFLNYPELEFFKQLIQISGVGPKSSLAVLSVAPLDVLKKAIANEEISYLTKVSGIGNRLASKIILELKDKLGAAGFEKDGKFFEEKEDALEALCSLGYSLKESREALNNIPDSIEGTGDIVKEVLKIMQKNKRR